MKNAGRVIFSKEVVVSKEDLELFLKTLARKRPATVEDYRKKVTHFLNFCEFSLTPKKLILYANDRLEKCKDPSKYLNPAVRFLEFLQNLHGNDYTNMIWILKQAVDKVDKKREKSTFAEEGSIYDIKLEDVHRQIMNILVTPMKHVPRLTAITAVAVSASTGLRPEELKRIEASDIDLKMDYFILPAEKSKTHTKRVIPLHPQVKALLGKLMERAEREELFPDGSIRYVWRRVREKGRQLLPLKAFRKFFAIHSARIGFDDVYRIAIAGHDTDELERLLRTLRLKVTEEFYRKFTPEEITKEYLNVWGKVSVLPPQLIKKWRLGEYEEEEWVEEGLIQGK
ncbi:site-specific integrase [Archaeoglobus profundus]|uniref:Integrase family protein n=1 Tax=Archaeoglobus profundus (strain DSM 5631 / JCM 9629 / NBRC 100127 / Av18) TaxID=572546 RepID=D2RI38_ARCPA|nr:site-specific integrase [Archaeoglobus profundus]ADB57963.1 integrase family protein [Archaeoglobus profundus DSM 5631]